MSNNENLLPSGLPRIESLEMRDIVKRFPGVLANDRVNLTLKEGRQYRRDTRSTWRKRGR